MAFYTPVTDDFESDIRPFNIQGSYTISDLDAASGTRCMRITSSTSGNRSATVAFTLHHTSEVSFDYRVSSEYNYDWLNIYIDGASVVRESGNGVWTKYKKTLPRGNHTITFQYVKDGSGDRNLDCGFIDNLTIPIVNMDIPAFVFYDDKGELLSTPIGEIVNNLTFGTLTAGTVTAPRKLTLMSTCRFPVQNVKVFVKPQEFPERTLAELSLYNNPFIPEEIAVFNGITLNYGDKVDFYVSIRTFEDTPAGGDWYVYAKGDPMLI